MRIVLASATLGAGVIVANSYLATVGGPNAETAQSQQTGAPTLSKSKADFQAARLPSGAPAAEAAQALSAPAVVVPESAPRMAAERRPEPAPPYSRDLPAAEPVAAMDDQKIDSMYSGSATVEQRPLEGRMSLGLSARTGGATEQADADDSATPAATVRPRKATRRAESIFTNPLGQP